MSQALIESFRQGHQSILTSIDQIQSVCRFYNQAKPLLRLLHEKIIEHLARQDAAMMNRLQDFYHEDREVSKILEFLTFDLKDIKVKFLIFYDKHSGEVLDLNARSFPKDFQDFTQEIIDRFNTEEEYLFPLMVKLP